MLKIYHFGLEPSIWICVISHVLFCFVLVQVVTEIVGAIEELTVTAKSCFCSSSRSLQQQILSKAFVR